MRAVTIVTGASNSRSFDCALARPAKARVEEKTGERSAQDDTGEDLLFPPFCFAKGWGTHNAVGAEKSRSFDSDRPTGGPRSG